MRRRVLFPGLLLVLLFAGLLAGETLLARRETSEALFFSAALKSADVDETVSVGDTEYLVADGSVSSEGVPVEGSAAALPLRLAYEKAAARRDPLIALPDVDPQDMLAAIEDLQETAQLLAQKQTTVRDAALVRTSLYPIDFLTASAELEQARLDFLESGSAADAYRYENAQQAAIRAYHTDISKFRNAFVTVVPEDTETYVTPTETVDSAGVIAALQTLDAAMSRTGDAVAKRLGCFRGNIAECDASDIGVPALPVTASPPLTNGALSLAEHIRALMAGPVGYSLDPQSEPLIQLSQSFCIAPQPGTGLLFSYRSNSSSEGDFSVPVFVGDVGLTPTAAYAQIPYYSYFATHGITYAADNPISYYACQESDRDIGTLEAIGAVREFALSARLSPYASGNTQAVLKRFEELASSGPVVTEEDAAGYIAAAETLVGTNAVSATSSDGVIELALELNDQSIGLYKTVRIISSYEQTNLALNNEGVQLTFSPVYLFFARSAFASLFLENNSSATGAHERLFQPNSLPASQLPYVYYSELPNTVAVQAEVLRDLKFMQSLHYEGSLSAPGI